MKRTGAQTRNRSGVVAALDIGTAKVCCFIGRVDGDGALRVIGIGHQVSRGVRAGAVIDMEAAESAVRATVEAAERMAGETIRDVHVNVSAGSPVSRLIAAQAGVAGRAINDGDVRRLLASAEMPADGPADHEVIHTLPVGYSIDGTRGVRDPRGMYGDRLAVSLHVVSASTGVLRNLVNCVSRCHLDVAGRVIAPYAAGLASLVEDERQLGATVLDMGAGTTSIAVFFDGELIHSDIVPVGGAHVTTDIARGLSTPLANAERIKTLYGSALPSPSDDREMITVPLIGEDDTVENNQVPRSMLVSIVRPRIEEIFEIVRARLEDAGFDKVAGRRLVLTGGASQLPGAAELAAMSLDKQVRRGRPRGAQGLAEAVAGPAFATCFGLALHAVANPKGPADRTDLPAAEPEGRFGRLGRWLRENF